MDSTLTWRIVYNQQNCLEFRYTELNETTVKFHNGTSQTEFVRIGEPCTFKTGDFLDLHAFALFRWFSFGFYLMLCLLCFYRYFQFWQSTPSAKRSNSIPLAMLLRLGVLDLFAVLYFQDTNVLEVYPIWFRSFLVFINNFLIISILIVLLYKVWASLLSDLNRSIDTKFVTQRKAYIAFGQLAAACAYYCIYFKNPLLSAIQWLILALELIVLFVVNFWFGVKVIREIRQIRSSVSSNMKNHVKTTSSNRVIRKILTLALILAAVVVIGFVYYLTSSISLFRRYVTDSQVYYTSQEIGTGKWFSLITVWIAPCLNNVAGISVFYKKKRNLDEKVPQLPSGSVRRVPSLASMRKSSNSEFAAAAELVPVPGTSTAP